MCLVFVITYSRFDLNLSWLKLLPVQIAHGKPFCCKSYRYLLTVFGRWRLNLIPLLFMVRSNLLMCDLATNSVRIVENFTVFWRKNCEKAKSFHVNQLASVTPFVLLTVVVMVLTYFLSYTVCFSE